MSTSQVDLRWRNVRTGIIFTLGLALAGWLALFIGKNTGLLTEHKHVFLFVTDIKGLTEGNLVSISGKKVGVVDKMKFVNKGDTSGILLDLDIRGEFFSLIPSDSKAIIKSLGVLGDKYVDISIGKSHAMVKDGQSLALLSEPGIEELTASAIKTMNAFSQVSEKIASGDGTIGRLIASNDLSDRINQTIGNLNTITAQFSSGNGLAPKLLNDKQMTNDLATALANFKELSTSIKEGKGTMGKFFVDETFYNNLTSFSQHSDSVLVALNSPNGMLGKLSKDQEIYTNMNATILTLHESMKSLDSLFVDLKKNPGRYLKVSVF
jgi:phospholipid/cholesterol/gamma-HCH transport system substrate-binding protein